MSVSVVILAAGAGTRMNSERPKVLHELGGAPLLHHAMRAAASLGPERVVVVTGVGAEAVARAARAGGRAVRMLIVGVALAAGVLTFAVRSA